MNSRCTADKAKIQRCALVIENRTSKPVRDDAADLEPLKTTYADDPRFRVAYDQMLGTVAGVASLAPVLGPQREVRVVTANATAAIFGGADVASTLTDAATQANSLIASYNERN